MLLESEIKAEQLTLKSLQLADAAGDYLSWMNDPDVTKYLETRFATHDRRAIEQYVCACNDSDNDLLLGMFLNNGRHIGNIKVGPINWRHKHAAVGLMIGARDCWGQGFARQCIAAVTKHAFEILQLEKLFAGAYATNVGSIRAFLAAGWSKESHQKDFWDSNGVRTDNVQLGISRAEWLASQ